MELHNGYLMFVSHHSGVCPGSAPSPSSYNSQYPVSDGRLRVCVTGLVAEEVKPMKKMAEEKGTSQFNPHLYRNKSFV